MYCDRLTPGAGAVSNRVADLPVKSSFQHIPLPTLHENEAKSSYAVSPPPQTPFPDPLIAGYRFRRIVRVDTIVQTSA